MNTQTDPPTPAVIPAAATGPCGLRNADSASGWQPYIKPGRTPSAAEDGFAHRCTSLRDRILRFERVQLGSHKAALSEKNAPPGQGGKTEATAGSSNDAGPFDEVHRDIRGSFQAGLVQAGGAASLDALNRQLDDIDRNFVTEHALDRYRNRVGRTLQIGVGFTVLMLALVVFARWNWGSIAELMDFSTTVPANSDNKTPAPVSESMAAKAAFTAYCFVILGVLLGRILTLFLDFGRELNSFADYDSAYRMISMPFLDASIDILIGFVACLCFVTGAIVIAIGQPEGGEAALSTLNIKDRWEIAMVFGLLVGLVRVNFLKRLSTTAATNVG